MAKKKSAPVVAIPSSENLDWGFFGTTVQMLQGSGERTPALEGEAAARFEAAGLLLVGLGLSPVEARDFLDSRHGRILADANLVSSPVALPSWIGSEIKRFRKHGGSAPFGAR